MANGRVQARPNYRSATRINVALKGKERKTYRIYDIPCTGGVGAW